ncbi:MAG: hypothetical protein ACPL7R_01125 [Anaerolineae bacterium]
MAIRAGWAIRSRREFLTTALLVVLIFLTLPHPVLAQGLALSLQEIAGLSQTAVVGTVSALRSHWNPAHTLILTTVTVDVEHVLKGTAGDTLSFEVQGGKVDGLGLTVSGMPTFGVGQRLILFLDDTPDGTVGGFQGRVYLSDGQVSREGFEPTPLITFLVRLAGAPGIRVPAGLWREAQVAASAVSAAAPSIASISPTKGASHWDRLRNEEEGIGCALDSTLVTITGSNFGAVQGTGRVEFFGGYNYWVPGCVDFWSDTLIRVRVPG